jgi:hypothetical protein
MKTIGWILALILGVDLIVLGLSEIQTSPYHTCLGVGMGIVFVSGALCMRRNFRSATPKP